MTGIQKTIIFTNYFGTGVMVPILSLFLLSHGCSLQSLAIVIGIYSSAVIVAEVPSGMFADIYGRKSAYYLSCVFLFLGILLVYLSKSLFLLVAGMVLFGLGQAFYSGSLDSLIIEDCLHRNGQDGLSKAAGDSLILQCGGIALGSLAGGFLPDTNGYLFHVLVRFAAFLAVALLSALFLKETRAAKGEKRTIKEQTSAVIGELKGKKPLRVVMFCIFGGSITMFALETYWQPQFSALILPEQHYLLGIICACGFGFSMLGSYISGKIRFSSQKRLWKFYLLFLLLYGVSLCFIAAQKSAVGFMAFYVFAMLMLGIANVPEQTLLNSIIPDEARSSLTSCSSLFSKVAGVIGSTLCAVSVGPLGISGILAVAGIITVFVIVLAAVSMGFGRSKIEA